MRVELEGKAPEIFLVVKGLTRDRATKYAKAGSGASWNSKNRDSAPYTNPIVWASLSAGIDQGEHRVIRDCNSGEGLRVQKS